MKFPNYRKIPQYPRYGVTCDGKVCDYIEDRVIFDVPPSKTSNYYHRVTLIESGGKRSSVVVHRLVAMAWVVNPDPKTKLYVNHIDGWKNNNHFKNLEWVTTKENNEHAILSGLRLDATKCRVRDTRTGEEEEFASIRKACEFMGISPDLYRDNLRPVRCTKLVAKFFEVRVDGDDRPWLHAKGAAERAGRYIITVSSPENGVRVFYDVRELIKTHGLWNMPSMSVAECLKRMARDYPDHIVEVVDQYEKRRIQALKLDTGEEFLTETLTDMSRLVGMNHGRLRIVLSRDNILAEKGYAFRYETPAPWPDKIETPVARSWGIMAEHETTGDKLSFDSLRQAADRFGVDRSLIKARLRKGTAHDGWLFKQVKQVNGSDVSPLSR